MAKRAFSTAQDMYPRAYEAFEDIQWDEKKGEGVAVMEKKSKDVTVKEKT